MKEEFVKETAEKMPTPETVESPENKLNDAISDLAKLLKRNLNSPDRDRVLSGHDFMFAQKIREIMYEGRNNPEECLDKLKSFFSPEGAQTADIAPEQMEQLSIYVMRESADRTFFESGDDVVETIRAQKEAEGHKITDGERWLIRANPYQYADEAVREKLKQQQNLKRRAAWEMYQNHFGKTPLSQESDGKLQATRLQILHMLMESAIDPDFRDEEFAREVIANLDIPEESERYGTPDHILTLRESRLKRYESGGSNCIKPPGGGLDCIDRQKLRDFTEGGVQSIQHRDGEINYQEFQKAKEGAIIQIDTSLRGLSGFIREGRYGTIHDKPEAVEEWENARAGYYGRRINNENTLGIRAKGTRSDEHVVSGYFFIPDSGLKPLPGQYGDYTLILKKNILNKAGYTQGDAFRTLDAPEQKRMNTDTAVLYALTPTHGADEYIEAQIYGGIDLEDVEDINLEMRFEDMPMSPAEKIKKILDFFDEIGLENVAKLAERMPNFRRQAVNLSEQLKILAEELEDGIVSGKEELRKFLGINYDEDIKNNKQRTLESFDGDKDDYKEYLEYVKEIKSFEEATKRYKLMAKDIIKLEQLKEPKAA